MQSRAFVMCTLSPIRHSAVGSGALKRVFSACFICLSSRNTKVRYLLTFALIVRSSVNGRCNVSLHACLSQHSLTAHRVAVVEKENIAPTPIAAEKRERLHGGTPSSIGRLHKPFKCPGSAVATRVSEKPSRKRRKVDYGGADGNADDGDKGYTNDDRLALATRDANRYPVFQVKDKEITIRKRFAVPLLNKNTGEYTVNRPPPLLGLRQGAVFVAKPLHDPSGEFALVLYDPTVDDKPAVVDEASKEENAETSSQQKLDEPIMHKSLAEILGIKKVVEERPRVPVVIDPRLTKVLRPHQVEGVKVRYMCIPFFHS